MPINRIRLTNRRPLYWTLLKAKIIDGPFKDIVTRSVRHIFFSISRFLFVFHLFKTYNNISQVTQKTIFITQRSSSSIFSFFHFQGGGNLTNNLDTRKNRLFYRSHVEKKENFCFCFKKRLHLFLLLLLFFPRQFSDDDNDKNWG